MLPRRAPARWLVRVLLGLASLVGLPGSLPASPPPATNDFCPVTPEEWAEPDISVEYRGSTVYFCCKRCRLQFLEDPGRYIDRLPQFLGTPAQPETTAPAPLSGAEHEGHDHARDHGERAPSLAPLPRTYRFAGRLHPVAVHFPIALVLAALLLELGFLMSSRPALETSARVLVPLAALTAILAATLGWAAGAHARYPGALAPVLEQHRWFGLATALVATLVAFASALRTRRPGTGTTLAYRVLLVLAAALVVVTGHLGATLIYGPEHLRW